MDNNLVKKVKTFKSGLFSFSCKYRNDQLIRLIVEANVLYQTVVDLPILPALSTQIEDDIIKRSIFGTAAIEGNPLSEEKVSEIITNPDRYQIIQKAEKEIRNLKTVYDFIKNLKAENLDFKLEEDLIKKIHKLVTLDLGDKQNIPGKYRNFVVKVGDTAHGGVYTPPKILEDIKNLMSALILWINSEPVSSIDSTIKAALVHYHFALIHPFADGNGRTARLIEALILRIAGIKYVPVMLSNYYYKNMDEYYWVFSKSIKNKEHDLTIFIEFVLKGVINSLEEIKDSIIYYIRKFTLRDYYKFLKSEREITQRQHDLLIILLENPTSFTLLDLINNAPFNMIYRKVSDRTARRDIKKLLTHKLLLILESGKYNLNFKVLG